MPTKRKKQDNIVDVDAMMTSDDSNAEYKPSTTAKTSRKSRKRARDDDSSTATTDKRVKKKRKTTAKSTSKSTAKKSKAAKKSKKKNDQDEQDEYSDAELDQLIETTASLSQPSDLWVEKYAPKRSSEILSHRSEIRLIGFWLRNFSANFVNKRKKPEPKPKDLKSQKQKRLFFESKRNRALLLSGVAGIGKTSCAHLVCKENGYHVVEWNASDVRSKKQIQAEISQLTGNLTMDAYFAQPNGEKRSAPSTKKRKVAIILDEVDGMSSGDRGGIQEIIKLIKDTKVPIICIANDARKRNIQTLTRHCLQLAFSRPRKDMIHKYIMKICNKEGLRIDDETLMGIIESLRNDIRCVLNNLQFMNLQKLDTKATSETIRKGAEQLNVFQVADGIFRTRDDQRTFNGIMNRHFYDPLLMPLFVQENYVNMRRSAWDEEERMDRIEHAADWISEGDLYDMRIRRHQEWQLAPAHAGLSTVGPSFFCHGGFENLRPGDQFIIHFPSSLGKGSTTRKNTGLLNMYRSNAVKVAPTSQRDMILDYIPMWNSALGSMLSDKNDIGGPDFGGAIDFMHEYGLTREDLDSLSELHTLKDAVVVDSDFKKVRSVAKAKLTRIYNQSSHNVSVAQVLRKQKPSVTMASIMDDEANKNEIFFDETKEDGADPLKNLDKSMVVKEEDEKKKKKGKSKAKAKKTTSKRKKK